MSTQSETRDGAARRLRAAIAEQDRLTYRHETSVGTAGEAAADADRRAAGQQVMARDAWLKWVDGDYRAVGAGDRPPLS